MFRLILSFMFIGVTMSSVYASDCVPPGVEPQKCNADCQLPSCACEDGEPDIPLSERPQVLLHALQRYFQGGFFFRVFCNIKSYTTSKNIFRLYTLHLMMLLLLLRRKNITEVYSMEPTQIQMDVQYVQLILFLLDLTTTHW